jgi:hypothetical protein
VSALKKLIPQPLRRSMRDIHIRLSMTHVHGFRRPLVSPTEPVVTCLVKNGEFYIDQFIEHYFTLGFRHIFFLDNGSNDGTVDRATRYKNVTVYRCLLPVGGLQGLLKRHFAERVVPEGWCVDVDIDEFFDFPYSDRVPIHRLFEYLNRNGYTSMLTQMLDMFSDRPLGALRQKQDEALKEVHRYYDLSHVRKSEYKSDPLTREFAPSNQIKASDAQLYWGGVRQALCGTDCLLTKHSVFRTGVGLELFPHVHYVNGARLADLSGVLLHYKFASNAYDEAAQNRTAFATNRRGYDKMMEVITRNPELQLKTDAAREFSNAGALVDSGFLFASQNFVRYAYALHEIAPIQGRQALV